MIRRAIRHPLAWALAVLLGANIVAAHGIATNRRGEPDAVVTLSERELTTAWPSHDDSGLFLDYGWRREVGFAGYEGFCADDPGPEPWLDRAKLAELGFDVTLSPQHEDAPWRYRKVLPREVLVVLELDGEAYARQVRRHERHHRCQLARFRAGRIDREALDESWADLDRQRELASRLFVVDAGLDGGELRRRHPDRARHLILPGTVELLWHGNRRREGALGGRVRRLSVPRIHVPAGHRSFFEDLDERRPQDVGWHFGTYQVTARPRFEVDVAVGRRHEAWIEGVRELDAAAGTGRPGSS